MWNLAVPIWELVLRSTVVYAFLIVLLRLTGKRQIGQLAPFDLVLLLVLSNAVQNSMNGGDNSLVGGLVSAATLVTLNYAIGYATFRSKRLEALIEGRPQVIIHNGRVFEDVRRHAKLTHHELTAALRRAGCSCPEEVQSAILENNGSISVVMRAGRSGSSGSAGDIRRPD
ncbi:MAG TPA: YetF domain-containing protein [Vicinamibacterales bacterium]|nr:YetF domain-containing protein [Vicinamibacterales bacterium]